MTQKKETPLKMRMDFHGTQAHVAACLEQIRKLKDEFGAATHPNERQRICSSANYFCGVISGSVMDFHKEHIREDSLTFHWIVAHELCLDMERKLHAEEVNADPIGYWYDIERRVEDGANNMKPQEILLAASNILGCFLRAAYLQGRHKAMDKE